MKHATAKRSKTKTTTRKAAARTPKRKPLHIHFGILSALLLILSVFLYVQQRDLNIANAGPPSAPSGKAWQQVWGDDFNGSSLDTNKWNVAANSNYGASNHEDECYRSANVSVSGGSLRLTGKRETVSCGAVNPDTGNSTYYFTSGFVTTRAQEGAMKYKFKQGYAEVRVKAPKGDPYWPAFWLVSPQDGSTPGWPDYGEFDIFELYGARPDVSTGTLHYKCTNSGGHCKTAPSIYNIKADSAYGGNSNLGTQVLNQGAMDSYSGGTTDFNTYGFLWEADKITWYVNGRKVRLFDGTNLYRIEQNGSQTLEGSTATFGAPAIPFSTVFAYDHSIILNLAIGGDGPKYSTYGYTGQDSASGYSNGNLVMQNPGVLEVDYVRVYQLANAPAPAPTPAPTPTPTPAPTPSTPTPTTPTPSITNPTPTTSAQNTANAENQPITIAENNQTISGDAVLSPELATSKEFQAEVKKVEYYIDGKLKQTITEAPYEFDTKSIPNGTYALTEKVYFKDGTTKQSKATVHIKNTSAVKKDAVTPWKGVVAAGAVLGILALALFMGVSPRGRSWSAAILRRFAR